LILGLLLQSAFVCKPMNLLLLILGLLLQAALY
jgi:hypothetical protein